MGKVKGTKNATPEEMRLALSLWHELGTAEEVERVHGIPSSSCRNWRLRCPDVWDEVGRAHARVVQERHAAHVEQAWNDLAAIAKDAAQELREHGAEMTPRDRFCLAKIVSEFAAKGDHAKRLDAGEVTAITETRTSDEDRMAEIQKLSAALGWSVAMDEDGSVVTTAMRGQRQ